MRRRGCRPGTARGRLPVRASGRGAGRACPRRTASARRRCGTDHGRAPASPRVDRRAGAHEVVRQGDHRQHELVVLVPGGLEHLHGREPAESHAATLEPASHAVGVVGAQQRRQQPGHHVQSPGDDVRRLARPGRRGAATTANAARETREELVTQQLARRLPLATRHRRRIEGLHSARGRPPSARPAPARDIARAAPPARSPRPRSAGRRRAGREGPVEVRVLPHSVDRAHGLRAGEQPVHPAHDLGGVAQLTLIDSIRSSTMFRWFCSPSGRQGSPPPHPVDTLRLRLLHSTDVLPRRLATDGLGARGRKTPLPYPTGGCLWQYSYSLQPG